jgi:hypothetical protein
MISQYPLLAVWLSVMFLQPVESLVAAGPQPSSLSQPDAYAAGLGSDLRTHCDLCWNPAQPSQRGLRSAGTPLHGHHIKKGVARTANWAGAVAPRIHPCGGPSPTAP